MSEHIRYPEEIKGAELNRLGIPKQKIKQNKELTLNCIMCIHCNDIIVATAVSSNLEWCKCTKVAIGGAKDYTRRIGIEGRDYEELSIWKTKE